MFFACRATSGVPEYCRPCAEEFPKIAGHRRFPSIASLVQKSSRKLLATEDSRVLPALSLLLLLPLQKVKKGSSRLGSAQNIRPQGLRTSPLSVDFDLDVEVEWIFFVEYRPRVPGRGQQPRLGQRRVGTPPRRAPRCKNGFGPVLLYWFPIKSDRQPERFRRH